MKNAQEIIDSVETIKYPSKEIKKKYKLEEKDYLKNICLNEKKLKPTITSNELSKNLGVDKETIEKFFEEEIKKSKEVDKKIVIKKKKERKFLKKIFNKIKIFLDKDDREAIREWTTKIILYGVPLNFALFVILGIEFNLYSWIGWGVGFWFIEKKFVDIIRGVWIK